MGLHVPEGYHFLGEWGRAWRDPKSGLWTVAGMREGSEGRVVLSDGEARAFARLVCRDEPATFATPAENETAMNASGGAGGEQARIPSVDHEWAANGMRALGLPADRFEDNAIVLARLLDGQGGGL